MKSFVLFALILTYTFSFTQTVLTPQTWYKANSGVYGQLLWYYAAFHNTEVMLWEDNSSNAWDAEGYSTWTNDCTPNFQNSTATDINYNPCLYFDGDDNYLNLSSNYPTSTVDGITYFVVVKPDQTTKTEAFVFDFGNFSLKGYGLTHSSNNSLFYSSTNPSMGGASNNYFHNYNDEPIILRYEIEFGVEQRIFYQGQYSPSQTSPITLPSMALQNISSHASNASSKGPFTIGRQSKTNGMSNNNIRAFQGYIMEIIGFNDLLSAQDIRTIETYLGLKYSITLDNTGYNQGLSLLNYRASDGTNLYSVSADPDYYHDIIGIGRDDETGLLQKQAHTQNDDFRLYLSSLASNNANNSGSFPSNSNPENIQFLVSGNNQGAMYATSQSLAEQPSSLFSRVEREWKIENSNYSGGFNIDLELGNYAVNSGISLSDLRLLIDDDGDFSDAQVYSSNSGIDFLLNGNTLTILNIQDSLIPTNSTAFFTIGSVGVGTPLNVELDYFTGHFNKKKKDIILEWKTLSEKDNDYFIIEKSRDGYEWKSIAKRMGTGTSFEETEYKFIDHHVRPGVHYYRLIQFNLDGEREELATETVNIKELVISLTPNPADNYINIDHPELEITLLEVYGLEGRKMDIPLPYTKDKFITQIDISGLPPGTYILVINDKSYTFIKR